MLVGHCADARYVCNLALEQTSFYRQSMGSTPNCNRPAARHNIRGAELAVLARGGADVGRASEPQTPDRLSHYRVAAPESPSMNSGRMSTPSHYRTQR